MGNEKRNGIIHIIGWVVNFKICTYFLLLKRGMENNKFKFNIIKILYVILELEVFSFQDTESVVKSPHLTMSITRI